MECILNQIMADSYEWTTKRNCVAGCEATDAAWSTFEAETAFAEKRSSVQSCDRTERKQCATNHARHQPFTRILAVSTVCLVARCRLHVYPRCLPRLFARRFSYSPGASQALQFVSSSPVEDFMPSIPVVHVTVVSTGAPPMIPPVQGTCDGAPVRTLRYLCRYSWVYAPRCPYRAFIGSA